MKCVICKDKATQKTWSTERLLPVCDFHMACIKLACGYGMAEVKAFALIRDIHDRARGKMNK